MLVQGIFQLVYYYVSNRLPLNCLYFSRHLLHRTFLYSLKIIFFRNNWQYIFKKGKILSLVIFHTPNPPNPSQIISTLFKGGLSPSKLFKKNSSNDSPLRMIKNAFYFILKALFFLKIFKFLSWHFGHVEKTTWLDG